MNLQERRATPGAPVPWYRNPPLRLLVAGSFLNSVAFFATLPFLALYLSDVSTLSEPQIGAVVGVVALIGAFGGFLGGVLGDRFGSVRLICAGLLTYITAYALLATTSRIGLIIALVVLLGVGRLLSEPSMKKLMSMSAAAGGTEGAVFRIRYVTICLGAIVGPPIGALLYSVSESLIFVLPACVFAIVLVLFAVHTPALRALDRPTGHEDTTGWRDALGDRALLLTVVAGVIVFFVFSQFESMLPLFLKSELGSSAVAYFSIALMANAALGITIQFPAARLQERMSTSRIVLLGCASFAVSLALFAAVPLGVEFLYLGVVLWTVGEALLIPMPDIVIHDLAPDDRKGAYFGLAELRYVGFFLGPVVGGALLATDPSLYFGAMALIIFAAWPLLSRVATNGAGAVVAMAPVPAMGAIAGNDIAPQNRSMR